MKRALLALAVLSGCGLHFEALFDRPDESGDAATTDGAVSDSAVSDAFPDDAPVGTGSGAAVGQYHSCAVRSGALLCFGDNPDGALGQGDTVARNRPTRVRFPGAIAEASAGEHFSCFRTDTGEVYCFGTNGDHELGLGDTNRRTTPTRVPLPGAARQISAGFELACALLQSGALYCWGSNPEGQLGQDEWPPVSGANPLRVGTASDWTRVAAGQGHVCGIRAPGALYCWGRSGSGELGLGDGAPIQVRVPTRVGMASDWIDIDTGQNTTCGIRGDGSLWCWGVNSFGQVGLPPSQPVTTPRRVGADADWASVSVDTFGTCARKRDNTLYCWGRNVEGQLGVGDNADRSSPTRVGMASDWVSVSVGRFHMCAQNASGAIACAGANDRGQLGVGDLDRRNALTFTR